MKRHGINQQLWQAFLIQAGLISLVAILSIYAARYVLSDVLIERALTEEADHFWSLFESDPSISRPNTYNLTGFLYPIDEIPAYMRPLNNGFHQIEVDNGVLTMVQVSNLEDKKLYLEFDNEQVGNLALLFGMLPLSVILLIIYLSSWIAYRFSSQAVSPIIQLAKDVEQLDPSSEEFSKTIKQNLSYSQNREVRSLADALFGLTERIAQFLERERNFTRDASHELRSPITVIKMASELLLNEDGLNEKSRKQVERIQRNANDMEELIETLLVLARESDHLLSSENISVNDIVREEIERAESLLNDKNINITINENQKLIVKAPDKVLSVMIGNIIRNAFSYTDEGQIVITVTNSSLIVEDSGIGIPNNQIDRIFTAFERGKQRGGYGVGLTIVKMISDRFNWPIDIDSKLNEGTKVEIQFQNR